MPVDPAWNRTGIGPVPGCVRIIGAMSNRDPRLHDQAFANVQAIEPALTEHCSTGRHQPAGMVGGRIGGFLDDREGRWRDAQAGQVERSGMAGRNIPAVSIVYYRAASHARGSLPGRGWVPRRAKLETASTFPISNGPSGVNLMFDRARRRAVVFAKGLSERPSKGLQSWAHSVLRSLPRQVVCGAADHFRDRDFRRMIHVSREPYRWILPHSRLL